MVLDKRTKRSRRSRKPSSAGAQDSVALVWRPFSYATFRLRVAAAFFADRDRSSAGRLAEALPPR